MYLDELDKKLLKELQRDSRQSYKALAEKLDVSDATIHKRVKTLQDKKIIKKFTALVDPEKAGFPVSFVINMEADPNQSKKIAERLAEIDEIYEVWIVAGAYTITARARVKDLHELQKMANNVLSDMEGVRKMDISLATKIIKSETGVNL